MAESKNDGALPEVDDISRVGSPESSGQNEAEGRTPAMPQPKRVKRGWIVAGVIVAVVAVAGAGMWVWHEQPSFCNSICHSPMDAYVESYNSGDAGLGVTAHAQAGKACLDCHEAEITTQVSEVCAWVSDSYPMDEEGQLLATGKEFASEEFCARSGCHDMQDVVDSTWGFEGNNEKYNPHSSHQDNAVECSDCHKIHETSTLYCAKCHDLNPPEGWEATNE